jgi:DMSO/TMAO reductase YedYZ heme-binding membrane subunit
VSPKRAAAIVCYGAAAIAVAGLLTIGLGHTFELERTLYLLRATGWSALVALLLALSASPIARLVSAIQKRPLDPIAAAFRRALGISAAALASVHAAIAVGGYVEWDRLLDAAWIRGGLLAWCILAALWITSYPRFVKLARVKLWRPLHRLAYAAGFFALQHAILSPLAPRGWVLFVFGLALVIAPLRLLPRPGRSEADDHTSPHERDKIRGGSAR